MDPTRSSIPWAQWAAGVEGETTLRVRVTDTGAVDSIEVTGSSGHLDLDSAAVAGVRTLRFEPGRMSGHRTRMWVTLPRPLRAGRFAGGFAGRRFAAGPVVCRTSGG